MFMTELMGKYHGLGIVLKGFLEEIGKIFKILNILLKYRWFIFGNVWLIEVWNDETMNVWLLYEYDGCEMMMDVLLWGIERNSYVPFIIILWSNVLTEYWVCDKKDFLVL